MASEAAAGVLGLGEVGAFECGRLAGRGSLSGSGSHAGLCRAIAVAPSLGGQHLNAPSLWSPLAAAPLDNLGAAAQLRDQAVQAAALRALQALATTGAPLLGAQLRRQLDDVSAHVAATSAAATIQLSADAESAVGTSVAALQLAAYQLLLATLLAPTPSRPRHLAPALRLFRDGSAGGGASPLTAFCRQVRCAAYL